MNRYISIVWLLIYLELKCYINLVKCSDTKGPEDNQQNTNETRLHGRLPARNPKYTTHGSVVIVEVLDIPAPELPRPPPAAPEKDVDLKTQVQSLNKYQLLDILQILSRKLKGRDPNYSLIDVIGRCVKKTSNHKHPVTLNIRDLFTEEEIDCDDIAKKITTYTAKGNFVFKKININSSKIWETSEPAECGTIVEYDKQDRNIKIFKLNGTTERLTFQVEPAEIGNLYTLNILRKVTTTKYRYSRDDDSDVFTSFRSLSIYKVKRGDEELFSFKDKVYPYQVVIGPNKQGKRKLECHFCLKPNNLIMIKSKNIDYDIQEEDTETVEEEFTSSKDEEEDEDEDEANNQDQEEDEREVEEDSQKVVEEDLDSSSDDEDILPDIFDTKGLKLIGLNLNGTESELNPSRYTLKHHVLNKDILVFEFKRNVQCARVKHNDTDVWFLDTSSEIKHDDDDDSETAGTDISDTVQYNGKRSTGTQTKGPFDDNWIHKYPVSVSYNTNALVIWVVFWTTYIEYVFIEGMWLQKVEAPADQPGAIHKRGIEIYTLGDDRKLCENDETKYELSVSGMQTSTLLFTFKEGSKCLLIRHSGNKIWLKRDRATPVLGGEKEYPLKIVYHVQAKTIFVVFSERYLGYVLMKKKWELKVNKPNAETITHGIASKVTTFPQPIEAT